MPETETGSAGADADGPAEAGGGLDEVADELYGVRPDEFIPRRDEAVARAREAGDRDLARAIGRLRRPTRAAWLSNLLARERPDQLEGLLGLAEGLADAQRTLDGAALRQLSSQRRKLVGAVAQEASRLARAEHEPVGDGLLRELQEILEAALADPDIADEVRSGRLTRSVSYSGFGPGARADAAPRPARTRPAPPRREPAEPAPEPEPDEDERERERRERERRAERERRERALAEARAEEETARDRQFAAEGARDDAVAARDDARDRVARLAAELESAREAERAAADAARDAETAARAAGREAGAAASRTARAQAALDELDGS
ncbi:hypothetical protein [Pseudonocardia humida]|uniref:Uncharacterized protein n=1 Tax=Pseudonocardia humida TaxID=2800819 RepID=A0ABT0ZS40_9PSEU|nr:hypothetical protein [Pseudonocardia humida]MCO1653519.1 hypothetical protein [Pseudonocardia humida]